MLNKIIADDWILTMDLWFRKQTLYQLSHNHPTFCGKKSEMWFANNILLKTFCPKIFFPQIEHLCKQCEQESIQIFARITLRR